MPAELPRRPAHAPALAGGEAHLIGLHQVVPRAAATHLHHVHGERVMGQCQLLDLVRAPGAVLAGLQGRELSVSGVFRYRNCYPAALELIASGAVDVNRLITHRFGLEETEAALTAGRREPESIKSVVLPQR